MSELSDLAEEVTKDLPIAVRKVIDKALENGWEVNQPGLTVALRLNHPTDDLALPVYITWKVGRTPKGALSFRFDSCGTAGLQPLRGPDLLEYLDDPTVAYTLAEEAEAKAQAKLDNPPWDKNATPEQNVVKQMGGEIIGIEVERPNRPKRQTFEEIQARARAQMGVPASTPVQSPDGTVARAEGYPAAPQPSAPKSKGLRVSFGSLTSGSSSKA